MADERYFELEWARLVRELERPDPPETGARAFVRRSLLAMVGAFASASYCSAAMGAMPDPTGGRPAAAPSPAP
ncbi:hypothetical protein [Aquihabitans sp. McL0605]|uniref:hypothetical protein n=1 Tax=Aquihabitans sp. McL0605 TaxID=3415671 RepID=UPI003CED3ED7